MSKTMRTYSTEFKQDAIRYVETHPELTMKIAADNLGVPKDTLYGWIKHTDVNSELEVVNR